MLWSTPTNWIASRLKPHRWRPRALPGARTLDDGPSVAASEFAASRLDSAARTFPRGGGRTTSSPTTRREQVGAAPGASGSNRAAAGKGQVSAGRDFQAEVPPEFFSVLRFLLGDVWCEIRNRIRGDDP